MNYLESFFGGGGGGSKTPKGATPTAAQAAGTEPSPAALSAGAPGDDGDPSNGFKAQFLSRRQSSLGSAARGPLPPPPPPPPPPADPLLDFFGSDSAIFSSPSDVKAPIDGRRTLPRVSASAAAAGSEEPDAEVNEFNRRRDRIAGRAGPRASVPLASPAVSSAAAAAAASAPLAAAVVLPSRPVVVRPDSRSIAFGSKPGGKGDIPRSIKLNAAELKFQGWCQIVLGVIPRFQNYEWTLSQVELSGHRISEDGSNFDQVWNGYVGARLASAIDGAYGCYGTGNRKPRPSLGRIILGNDFSEVTTKEENYRNFQNLVKATLTLNEVEGAQFGARSSSANVSRYIAALTRVQILTMRVANPC